MYVCDTDYGKVVGSQDLFARGASLKTNKNKSLWMWLQDGDDDRSCGRATAVGAVYTSVSQYSARMKRDKMAVLLTYWSHKLLSANCYI